MSVTVQPQRTAEDLLRESIRALRDVEGPAAQMALDSMLASIGHDDKLLEVARAELAPEQASITLHLTGVGVNDHETRADLFGLFVRGLADATKEVAKSLAGFKRLPSNLLIAPVFAGSVGVTLRVPDEPNPHRSGVLVESPNVESMALRVIADLMTKADIHDPDDEQLGTAAQAIGGKAKTSLRAAARRVLEAGWEIEGEIRQRGVETTHMHLDAGGAARLVTELGKRAEETTFETLTGVVDGSHRSVTTMWFIPRDRAAIEAAVATQELFEDVAVLATKPGTLAEAKFSVVRSYPTGDSSRARETRVLQSIRVLPTLQDEKI